MLGMLRPDLVLRLLITGETHDWYFSYVWKMKHYLQIDQTYLLEILFETVLLLQAGDDSGNRGAGAVEQGGSDTGNDDDIVKKGWK